MAKDRSLVIAIVGVLVMAFMVGIMTQATEKNSVGDAGTKYSATYCKQVGMIADAYCHPWLPDAMNPNDRAIYAEKCTRYTAMYFSNCFTFIMP